MNNFDFVDDKILRENLDRAFNHILNLIAVLGGKDDELFQSSFRKTIIIHTASIIEALLLSKLKNKIKSKKIELRETWKYNDIKILHKFSESRQLIAATRNLEKKELDRLDLVRIIDLCFKYKIVGEDAFNNLNKVRELRNNLHIGNMKSLDKQYNDKDLEFAFFVAAEVKKIVSRK